MSEPPGAVSRKASVAGAATCIIIILLCCVQNCYSTKMLDMQTLFLDHNVMSCITINLDYVLGQHAISYVHKGTNLMFVTNSEHSTKYVLWQLLW